MTEPERYDLAIVGAGPAGMAAAVAAANAGLSVILIDEQARMGGQILRQPPEGLETTHWLPGGGYRRLKALLASAESQGGVTWRGRTSALGLFRNQDGAGFELWLAGVDGVSQQRLSAERVLVATGCYDLPLPLPGWTLPGVMGAGAVQAFVKSQQFVPGERLLVAGTHPLAFLVAHQLVEAGGEVPELVIGWTPAAALLRMLRRPLTTLGALPQLLQAAVALAGLLRRGVKVRFGWTVAGVEGAARVTGASLARLRRGRAEGASASIACDRVALCFGFLPQSDLPRSVGAEVRWAPGAGGYATKADAWQRSTAPGLYVAGETTGMGGAETAMTEGRIAGLAIAMDAGRLDKATASNAAEPLTRKLGRLRAFAGLLEDIADPSALALATPSTVICRCEGVTLGAVTALLGDPNGPRGANAIKLVSRVGMGLCQGRMCEASLRRITSLPTEAEGFAARFPARPVSIAQIAQGS